MERWALRTAAAGSLLLLALVVASCGGITARPDSVQQEAPTVTPVPTAPAPVRPTYLVQRGDVQELLTFSGRWLPRDQVQLSFAIAGTIRRVAVQRGDTVTVGQLLADYQISQLEDQLAAAQLQLETAKSSLTLGNAGSSSTVADAEVALANAKLNLEAVKRGNPWADVEAARVEVDAAKRALTSAQRAYNDAVSRPTINSASTIETAFDQLASAKEKLRTAQALYDKAAVAYAQYQPSIAVAQNQVTAAQLALDRAKKGGADPQRAQAVSAAQLTVDQLQQSIKQSSLFASIDGEVLDVLIKPGDQVAPFAVVITVGRSEPKEIVASLAITDAQRLSAGVLGVCQQINRPETAVQCIVRRIPLDPREADQTSRIAASLDNVVTGELVEVNMPLQVRKGVLWLPPTAVRTFQNRTYVIIQTPDGQRVADIEVGLRTTDRVEIKSGLKEGDVVVGP